MLCFDTAEAFAILVQRRGVGVGFRGVKKDQMHAVEIVGATATKYCCNISGELNDKVSDRKCVEVETRKVA